MIVSERAFWWFCVSVVIGISSGWFVFDVRFLRAALKEEVVDKDKVFGAVMGLAMCLVGFVLTYRLLSTL